MDLMMGLPAMFGLGLLALGLIALFVRFCEGI